jgi:glycosyltransferase involved in cell wall biosynthesis
MQIIPDLGIGGAEIMVEILSLQQVSQGMQVKVISLYNHQSAITNRMKENRIDLVFLDKMRGFDHKIIWQLVEIMQEFKPDVVHSHLYAVSYAMIAAIRAKVPVKVHTIHNIAVQEFGKRNRLLNRFFYHYCDLRPVSISPEIRKTVQLEYKLLENQVAMIYNGINLSKIRPKDNYQIKGQAVRIIHVGSFKEQKNHAGMIRSFRIVCDRYPNAKLQLIGGGDLQAKIKALVESLKLEKNVEFLGLQSDVFGFLNQADIFILPSLWEGMPISLIEAMATGLPVVATGVGGVPDMIEHEVSGLIVDINEELIAASLINLIENEHLRKNYGLLARQEADRFSDAKMAGDYFRLYQENLG